MYLNADKTKRALDLSAEVLSALGINDPSGKYIPVSIEELQDYVVQRTGWKVEKYEVIYPQGQYIKGRIHRFDNNTALIHVRRGEQSDWKRLVAAKELFEILVADKPEDMCPYGDEILDALVFDGHIGVISPANGDMAQTELISELAAMETLYPLVHQVEDLKSLHPNGQLTVGKLSLKYGLPEGTVSTMLNSKYRIAIEKARLLG